MDSVLFLVFGIAVFFSVNLLLYSAIQRGRNPRESAESLAVQKATQRLVEDAVAWRRESKRMLEELVSLHKETNRLLEQLTTAQKHYRKSQPL